jgi:predicted ABC-type ATPase
VTEHSPVARIFVLAGTNGAGKSSVMGAMVLEKGATFFDPDAATRKIIAANDSITLGEANSMAWHDGVRMLQQAIDERLYFVLETTLGGSTIAGMLESALERGAEVSVWYVGLNSPELHVARVRARVLLGGHDIPEEKIRERYEQSQYNLIRLLPRLTELQLFDNSEEADRYAGIPPKPKLILHMDRQKIVGGCDLTVANEWTRAILVEAYRARRN